MGEIRCWVKCKWDQVHFVSVGGTGSVWIWVASGKMLVRFGQLRLCQQGWVGLVQMSEGLDWVRCQQGHIFLGWFGLGVNGSESSLVWIGLVWVMDQT